jgi:hypothetical protein
MVSRSGVSVMWFVVCFRGVMNVSGKLKWNIGAKIA